ncbi:MAG: glycosyltransferase family 4 protein [Patescibacteria group bacterium]|jgi:phosphatidylinositol alpha-1,6-mannosyltransferase|nr:glycosyltransferase family 4 protein [Patescibacteria group bacterium]
MKTLLVTLEYKPFKGGVAEYYSSLFENWPDEEILVLSPKANEKLNESDRIIRRNLISTYFSWLSSFYHVWRVVRENNIKHVIVGQILPLGTVVWALSYLLGFEYSVILHGMDYTFSQKKNRKKILAKIILSKSIYIIVGNSYLHGLMKNYFPKFAEKISVVNPGVSMVSHEISHAISRDFVLFFVGRLVKRKGVDKTIEAFKYVDKKKYPDIKFRVAGAGPDEEYLKDISDDSRIEFIGRISDTEKWNNFSNSNVFIMPSREMDGDFEGFGIVYLEANLAGLPVIANNSGGVSDAVVDGLNGILLENDKPKNIADAIIKLYENRESGTQLGKNGKERVLKDFLWDKQTLKIYNIINK